MNTEIARCLILACGNTLREDDGVGPFLASWAEERFSASPNVRVLIQHQWTPELSAEIAEAQTVLFIDCAVNSIPGSVTLAPVEAAAETPRLFTHHLDATALLALARDYYSAQPGQALLLTIGAASLQLREAFSDTVSAALPEAQRTLEEAVLSLLDTARQRK
jgi:hydrogenase maturation protease